MSLINRPSVFLWLDDIRTPPKEWRWCKTVAEAIELMETEDVEAMSLDHDLDDFTSAGAEGGERTGYHFVYWMADRGIWSRQQPIVHSANFAGRDRMVAMIERYWPERVNKR